MTKKIICVWIGTFKSEDKLYKSYLNFDYTNDEDFMESWWFSKLELNELTEYKDDLLDSEYFFDELIAELKNRDLTNRNSISFLFGEKGAYPTNEILFEYNGMESNNKPIEFVYRKEYEVK